MQGMTPSARKQHEMEREARERARRELLEATKHKRAAAKRVMAMWNAALAAGWRTIFYPSVGTALVTGCHWLHVVCPACQQMGEVDLRKIDIHPNASIGTVVRAMPCKRCSPHPPFARPLGATRRSWYTPEGWLRARNASRHIPLSEREPDPDIGWAQRQIARKRAKDSGTT